jgi:RNA polymerase sigma factor (sigma-70 family)
MNKEVKPVLEATDLELIQKTLDGDQDAFSHIVTRYKRLVYSIVFNMVKNREEADDVSQEVFLRIYKALARYNPEFKFSTWASKITTNLCMDILRKKKHDTVPIEDALGVSDGKETPEEEYISNEKSKRIRKAIEELPEMYRVPVILFHQNGLSYEEMMKILNEPMTIIKNRLYRARLLLREKLSESRKEGVV